MTPERLRPHLEGWLSTGSPGRTFVVHLDGPWSGAEQLLVGDQYVDVRVCASELAVREELARPRPDGRTVVLLSPADVRGADVLARIAKRHVLRLHAWEAVQQLFGVRQIDPELLREKWMAEALVEAAPVGGYERTAAQGLDADRAWRALLQHRYGIDADAGLPGLLAWAAGLDTSTLLDRGETERKAVTRRIRSTIQGADPVLAAAAAGKGPEALALGLVVRVLLDGPSGDALTASRTLLGVMLGGWVFDESAARAWTQAAETVIQDLLAQNAPAGQAALQAAESVITSLQAEALVGASDLLAAGLRSRLADLGTALAQRRDGKGDPLDIERVAERVRTHRLDDHRDVATMVVRLVRWLADDAVPAGDFRGAAAEHAASESYADWARTALRVATGEQTLDTELRALVAETDEVRRAQDTRFAGLLAQYVGHAAAGGPVLGVEEVLDRVVAPLAGQRPVLFLVLDGMSHRVASELLEDVVDRGWIELRPTDQDGRTLVLSALPSVTQFSRTSLLSGTLGKGAQLDEAKAFAGHAGLAAVSKRGGAPVLFHKGALKDPHGGLASELRDEVGGERRVIGAVINAIDDHLDKGDQVAAPWDASYIPLLRLLLEEGRNAGRLVILASDHGHVLERGGSLVNVAGEHGQRWRVATSPTGPGEQLVEGTRVLVPGGRCVLAVDENVRFAPRKHGYHGGGSPQEVIAPLLVLAPGLADGLEGWVETPYDPPAWWTGQAAIEPLLAQDVAPASVPVVEEPTGQLTLGAEDPAVGSSGVGSPAWVAELLASEAFADGLAAASRARVPAERITAILIALDAAGGKLLKDALARRIGVAPLRLRGMLATISLVLNIDGSDVLTVNEDTDDVILNLPLLREQFSLGAP